MSSYDDDDEFEEEFDLDPEDIKIPGVDAVMGSDLYGGEMDIYVSAMRSFVANIPAAIDRLRSVSQETLGEYATNVHGLKGSCSSIGAESVRVKAYELEMKSKAGDLSTVLAKNDALLTEAEQLIKDIKAWLDGLDANN
jgi:HPt (histidine-containing phosphotransfer) domain-containing protein